MRMNVGHGTGAGGRPTRRSTTTSANPPNHRCSRKLRASPATRRAPSRSGRGGRPPRTSTDDSGGLAAERGWVGHAEGLRCPESGDTNASIATNAAGEILLARRAHGPQGNGFDDIHPAPSLTAAWPALARVSPAAPDANSYRRTPWPERRHGLLHRLGRTRHGQRPDGDHHDQGVRGDLRGDAKPNRLPPRRPPTRAPRRARPRRPTRPRIRFPLPSPTHDPGARDAATDDHAERDRGLHEPPPPRPTASAAAS